MDYFSIRKPGIDKPYIDFYACIPEKVRPGFKNTDEPIVVIQASFLVFGNLNSGKQSGLDFVKNVPRDI